MFNRFLAILVLVNYLLVPVSEAQASPQGFFPLGGIYADSLSGVSGRIGLGYAFSSLREADDKSISMYVDAEFGSKASRLSVGAAYVTGYTISRIGVSVAEADSKKYIGIEAVHSVLLLAFKLGVYGDTDSDERVVSVGIGFGF